MIPAIYFVKSFEEKENDQNMNKLRQKLLKTLQNEAIIPLITKLIYPSGLRNSISNLTFSQNHCIWFDIVSAV